MRTLVISDLHANWPDLEAVLSVESHDLLLVVGDLVSYGPHARQLVEYSRHHATVAVRGNHDQALAHDVDCRCAPASKPLAEATRARHRDQPTTDDIAFLGGLPLTASVKVGAQTPTAPDTLLAEETGGVDADFVLLGHTHLPVARRIGGRTVLNPGSVGQPRDGDPRASYALIEDGNVRLKRAAYDVERTVRDLGAMGLAADVTDRLVAILRTGAA